MRESPHPYAGKSGVVCGMNCHIAFLPVKTLSALPMLFVIAAGLFLSPLHAQISSQQVAPPVQTEAPRLTLEELSQLLAPIALYPDALVALILPASTVPSDVVLGARYVKADGDPAKADNQPWDESVKSLARYPDVLTWLDENLEWTSSVGEAFVEQPADVMNAIQLLRKQAKAAGHLVDTPQQKVIEEEEIIRIVPADPEVIYVPQYDPQVVYIESYSTVPVLTFGLGFAVGSWLSYDFDWNRRCFYRGNWRGWNHDWYRNQDRYHDRNGSRGDANVVNIDINSANQWQPTSSARRQITQRQRNNNGNARFVDTRPSRTNGSPARRNDSAQTAIYNPASNPALPRPTRLERVARENTRESAPGRNGAPAANPTRVGTPPSSPEERPNRRDGSGAQPSEGQKPAPTPTTDQRNSRPTPDRPNHTRPVPSTPPVVPGQLKTPGQPSDEKKEARPSKRPDRFTEETPTAIREEKPSASQPPATPRPSRERAPNPTRSNGNPTTPPPMTPPNVTSPGSSGKSRTKEPAAEPKQTQRVSPVVPNVPKQDNQPVPRHQQTAPSRNSHPETVVPQPPRVKAPAPVQQPAPVTRSPSQPSERPAQQRPVHAEKPQQVPQQPPQQRPAPAPRPQAPPQQVRPQAPPSAPAVTPGVDMDKKRKS